jgi:DNA-binding PadR family transcriptional regulator
MQALAAGPCWADGIRQRVEEATGMRLSRGNVTGAITGLLEQQLIEPAGEQPRADLGGKPRKLYRLTGAGTAEAGRQREAMSALMALADGRRGRCGTAIESTDRPSERWVEPDGDAKLLPAE